MMWLLSFLYQISWLYVRLDLKYNLLLSKSSMTITLSLNILLPICNWMKYSPTGISVPLPAPDTVLLHLISFGLFPNLLKNLCDITLIDAHVSYNASIFVLFTLTLYKIALSEFTSSMVTSFMTFSSQSVPEPASLSCKPLISCLACSMEYIDSCRLLEKTASFTEMLLFLAFFRSLSLYFLAISALLKLYLSLSFFF